MRRRDGFLGIFSTRHLRAYDMDWHVLLVAIALLALGTSFVHGVASSKANQFAQDVSFESHRQKMLVALPLLLAAMFVRPAWLRRNAPLVYAGALGLLVAVFFVGDERNNARRWIQFGRFDLQPSELAKVAVIVMLARLLAENRLRDLGDWARPLAAAGLPMLLVAGQPDLGTALTLVPITLGMLYLAGARARTIGTLVLGGVFAGWMAYSAGWIRDYQLERIETWVGSYAPEDLIQNRNGTAFHLYHARVAAGNGGLYGRGLGEGVANETGLLPERESDSIFMVVAEEAGFLGAVGVLLLYGTLVVLLMLSASSLRDRYARLVVGGVGLYFASHLVINVAVNVGLLPMTGLTLPLFSTGGSSLLATFVAIGLALGTATNRELRLDEDAFRPY